MVRKVIEGINQHFCPLSDQTMDDWTQCIKVENVKKGHVLVKEGQLSDKLYFITNGSCKTYYLRDGKRIVEWFSFQFDFICALQSFYNDLPSEHYIELMEDGLLFTTTKADIDALCAKHHDFEHFGRMQATNAMLQLQKRVVALQFRSAEERYHSLIKDHPQIEMTAPLGDIASYLGMTQETLSRLRATKKRN